MLRGLGGAICDPAKCLSCGECVEELAKALHFAVLECDEVNEVSLVLTACGPDSTLGVPHDGNRVQIGKKVSWLENQDFFGFVAHAQPLEEAFVPVPDSAGGVERVRRLTPLDARTEHVQDAGNVPDRERLVQRLDERDVLVRVRHVALLSGAFMVRRRREPRPQRLGQTVQGGEPRQRDRDARQRLCRR